VSPRMGRRSQPPSPAVSFAVHLRPNSPGRTSRGLGISKAAVRDFARDQPGRRIRSGRPDEGLGEGGRSMAFDLVVWSSPRDLDPDAAGALVRRWLDEGGDPAASPFEASSDIGWFVRELRNDLPDIDVVSDAV